jgi:hypothetical protein
VRIKIDRTPAVRFRSSVEVIDDLKGVKRFDGTVAVDVEEWGAFSVGRLVRESAVGIAVSTAVDLIDDRQDVEGGNLLVRVLENA